MGRQGARLALKLFLKLFRRLRVALLVIVVSVAGAQAQAPERIVAKSVVETLYRVSSMLEQQGATLESGGHVFTSFRAFFSPQLIEQLEAADVKGFRPLVGSRDGTVDDYEVRYAKDQPAAEGETIIEVAVKSGGAVRLVSFALVSTDGERPFITQIWGDGWSYGGDAVQEMESSSAAGAESLSAEELTALVAADQGASEQGHEPTGDSALELPFQDEFNGDALADHWNVVNKNMEKFVLDGGVIYQIASGGNEDFRKAGAENIFRLDRAPTGDFDMTLTGLLEAKTGYEGVWLGLYESETNFLAVNMHVYTKGCGPSLYLWLVNRQPQAEEEASLTTEFNNNLFDDGPVLKSICHGGNRQGGDRILEMLNETGFELTLSRRGFLYHASLTLDLPALGDRPAGPITVTSSRVMRTTPAGQPAFELGQFGRAKGGETVSQFDRFAISSAAR